MFENPRRLFDRYYCKHVDAKTPGFDEHLASEARVRLCQVHELYNRLVRLEKDLLEGEMRADPPPSAPGMAKIILHDVAKPVCDQPDPPLRPFTSADEVRISLEAFYYNANRVRDLFQDGAGGLPGLQTFEAAGVRDVRHHLVEHPTRNKGVKVMSIALGGPVGPQLKPMTWSKDPPGTLDNGLYANAREFCSALESSLLRALGAGAA